MHVLLGACAYGKSRPSYLPTYLPTYFLTGDSPTYLPTYLPAHLRSGGYSPTYLPTYLLSYCRFHFDGALPERRRCVHVNFIDRTDGTVRMGAWVHMCILMGAHVHMSACQLHRPHRWHGAYGSMGAYVHSHGCTCTYECMPTSSTALLARCSPIRMRIRMFIWLHG